MKKKVIFYQIKDLQRAESENLAPYAMKSRESKGSDYPEVHPYRTIFQRDRDKIIHSDAFRRLQDKTQVFNTLESGNFRTRLTHSLEVAQISKVIARVLAVNEDLVEAIALLHDVGHTPFGHHAEAVLDKLMIDQFKKLGKALTKGEGFNHQVFGLRIVEELEVYRPNYPGLNLSFETREGLIKHATRFDFIPKKSLKKFEPEKRMTLEGQIVKVVDEIAFAPADLHDGLRANLIAVQDRELRKLSLWKKAFQATGGLKVKRARGEFLPLVTTRWMIGYLVGSLLEKTKENLEKFAPKTSTQVRNLSKDIVGLTPEVKKELDELKEFLYKYLYTRTRVQRMNRKAEIIIKEMFKAFVNDPYMLPKKVLDQRGQWKNEEEMLKVIGDYLALLTDREAVAEYQKLFSPLERV